MILNYWNQLNERERWMSGFALFFALVYLLYRLIYSPLSSAVSQQTKQLMEKRETLVWMKQVQEQTQNQKSTLAVTNTKLLALIDNQLANTSFKQFTHQLQLRGSGDIQLSFERVPYKELIQWLWKLSKDYAISLKQFSAERTDTPGIVKVSIILSGETNYSGSRPRPLI